MVMENYKYLWSIVCLVINSKTSCWKCYNKQIIVYLYFTIYLRCKALIFVQRILFKWREFWSKFFYTLLMLWYVKHVICSRKDEKRDWQIIQSFIFMKNSSTTSSMVKQYNLYMEQKNAFFCTNLGTLLSLWGCWIGFFIHQLKRVIGIGCRLMLPYLHCYLYYNPLKPCHQLSSLIFKSTRSISNIAISIIHESTNSYMYDYLHLYAS